MRKAPWLSLAVVLACNLPLRAAADEAAHARLAAEDFGRARENARYWAKALPGLPAVAVTSLILYPYGLEPMAGVPTMQSPDDVLRLLAAKRFYWGRYLVTVKYVNASIAAELAEIQEGQAASADLAALAARMGTVTKGQDELAREVKALGLIIADIDADRAYVAGASKDPEKLRERKLKFFEELSGLPPAPKAPPADGDEPSGKKFDEIIARGPAAAAALPPAERALLRREIVSKIDILQSGRPRELIAQNLSGDPESRRRVMAGIDDTIRREVAQLQAILRAIDGAKPGGNNP